MQRLADVQEQNFTLKQRIKALDEAVRQRAGDCEQQRQIVAALGTRVRLSDDESRCISQTTIISFSPHEIKKIRSGSIMSDDFYHGFSITTCKQPAIYHPPFCFTRIIDSV